MNRITTAESSVSHKSQTTRSRTDILQGKLVLSEQGRIAHSVFMPMHYESNYAYPLVVWLHGDEDDERQLHRIMPHLSLRNYVAAAPRGLPQGGLPQGGLPQGGLPQGGLPQGGLPQRGLPDGSFADRTGALNSRRSYRWSQTEFGIEHALDSITQAIEHASTRTHVNLNKVVLVGFESGATMALRIGLRTPERFAGVVAIGGGMPIEDRPLAGLSKSRQLPLLLCQGRYATMYDDEQLSRDLRLLHIGGFSVTMRQYPCGDDLVDLMLRDANSWIMERVAGGVIS